MAGNWNTSDKPLTIESLKAAMAKFGPAPPPPDNRACENCGRSIGTLTAHPISMGTHFNIVLYLCWTCRDALEDCCKQEPHP